MAYRFPVSVKGVVHSHFPCSAIRQSERSRHKQRHGKLCNPKLFEGEKSLDVALRTLFVEPFQWMSMGNVDEPPNRGKVRCTKWKKGISLDRFPSLLACLD